MKDKLFFDFSFPLDGNALMTTVRLTVGGLAAAAGLDMDAGEDFKVCVTESLLIFRRNGFSAANAHFELSEGLTAVLSAQSPAGAALKESLEDEISYSLLGALLDDVSFTRSEGAVNGVTLIKRSV